MRNIGIITNLTKDTDFLYTKKIIDFLREKGCNPVFDMEAAKNRAEGKFSEENDHKFESYYLCDFIIVLGGDGTMLEAARKSAYNNIPLLGINLGTLGYLTDVDKTEGLNAIEKVLNGDFKTEKRMMIEATINNRKIENELVGLNDICILRGNLSKMINLEVYVNEQYIDNYKADGIIISSPTGSTAYNLSAGGPVLKPDIELIAITPICPHKMHSRPLVISALDEVNIVIGKSQEEDIILSIDGQKQIPLLYGDEINIKRSRYFTSIIKTSNLGFYDTLRKKLIN